MAGLTQSMLVTLKFEVLIDPMYSSDVSPGDNEVSGSLKKFLEGKRLYTDEDTSWGGILERRNV